MEQTLITILFLIPEILTVLGILLILKRILFLKNSEVTSGEVTSIEIKEISAGFSSRATRPVRLIHLPVIHFQDQSGVEYKVVIGASGRFLNYSVGDKVPVIFSKNDPKNSFLNEIYFLWFTPAIATTLGILLLFVKYIKLL